MLSNGLIKENTKKKLGKIFEELQGKVDLSDKVYSFEKWLNIMEYELEVDMDWFQGNTEKMLKELDEIINKEKKAWLVAERNTKKSLYSETRSRLKKAKEENALQVEIDIINQTLDELLKRFKNWQVEDIKLCDFEFVKKKRQDKRVFAIYLDMKRELILSEHNSTEEEINVVEVPIMLTGLPFGVLGTAKGGRSAEHYEIFPKNDFLMQQKYPFIKEREVHEKIILNKSEQAQEMVYGIELPKGLNGIVELKELNTEVVGRVLHGALQALNNFDVRLLFALWKRQKHVHTPIPVSVKELTKELFKGARLRANCYEDTRASILKMGTTSYYLYSNEKETSRVTTVRIFSSLNMTEELETGYIYLQLSYEIIKQFMQREVIGLYADKLLGMRNGLACAIVFQLERERQMVLHQEPPTRTKRYHLQDLIRFIEVSMENPSRTLQRLKIAFQDMVNNGVVLESFKVERGLYFELTYLPYTEEECRDLLHEIIDIESIEEK